MKRTTQQKLTRRPRLSTAPKQRKPALTSAADIALISEAENAQQKVIVRQSTLESIHARLSNIDESLQKMALSMLVIEKNQKDAVALAYNEPEKLKPVKRSEPEDFPKGEQMELPLAPEPAYPTVDEVREACKGLDRDYLIAMLNSFGANRISDITPGERQAFIDNVTKEN
jgi:hypothetical protein